MISQDELGALESDVAAALESGDRSKLNVIGFGEISVALGYPAADPHVVCKRSPPMSAKQLDAYTLLVGRYIDELADAGVLVAPTTVMSVVRSDSHIAYLVQPLLDSSTLGHKVLAAAEPDADHPFVAALADTIQVATDQLSVDAQVTNWSWTGDTLTLIDVGTPFMWDRDGELLLDMTPLTRMLPAPVRGVVSRDVVKIVDRWQTPRGVALDIVANLYREGLDDWVDPMVEGLGRTTGAIDKAEAHKLYVEDGKTFPRIKKLQLIERAWRRSVRRRPYDFFVQETTFG